MKSAGKRRSGVPALEWLCDLTGQAARITSMGNNMLLVENHRGILELSDTRIVLNTHCGEAEITGSGLYLSDVRTSALIIRGSITDVKLPCGKAARP